jgi:hypothetical protein
MVIESVFTPWLKNALPVGTENGVAAPHAPDPSVPTVFPFRLRVPASSTHHDPDREACERLVPLRLKVVENV